MKKKWRNQLNSEAGVTLVELLAAIAILSIIVTFFLAYFIQAANTNSQTNEVNEATFLAQEQMEEVTYLASNGSFDIGEKVTTKNNHQITTTITEVEDSQLLRVIVEVHKGGKLRAKMETRVPATEAPPN